MQGTQITVDVKIVNKPTTTYQLVPSITIKSHTANGTPIPIIKGASVGQHYQSMVTIMNDDIVVGDTASASVNANVFNTDITNPAGNNIIYASI